MNAPLESISFHLGLVVWRCRQRGQNVQLTREARDENQFHFQSNIIYLRSSGSIRISGRSIRFGQGIHVFSKVSLYSISVVEILVRTPRGFRQQLLSPCHFRIIHNLLQNPYYYQPSKDLLMGKPNFLSIGTFTQIHICKTLK